jgi:hypothetical protein
MLLVVSFGLLLLPLVFFVFHHQPDARLAWVGGGEKEALVLRCAK